MVILPRCGQHSPTAVAGYPCHTHLGWTARTLHTSHSTGSRARVCRVASRSGGDNFSRRDPVKSTLLLCGIVFLKYFSHSFTILYLAMPAILKVVKSTILCKQYYLPAVMFVLTHETYEDLQNASFQTHITYLGHNFMFKHGLLYTFTSSTHCHSSYPPCQLLPRVHQSLRRNRKWFKFLLLHVWFWQISSQGAVKQHKPLAGKKKKQLNKVFKLAAKLNQ